MPVLAFDNGKKVERSIRIRQWDILESWRAPKTIFLCAVLMDDGEIIFAGKSIGRAKLSNKNHIFEPIEYYPEH